MIDILHTEYVRARKYQNPSQATANFHIVALVNATRTIEWYSLRHEYGLQMNICHHITVKKSFHFF